MQRRRIADTNISVSVLGLGTVKWGRKEGVKYPYEYDLPTDSDLLALLSIAKEYGINLIDTAPAYGESETRLGKLLKKERQNWVICTKAGEMFQDGVSAFDFRKSAIRKSVEDSLKRLNTDYLDIVLIHSDGDDVNIIQKELVLETLDILKAKGIIRAIGMSTKTVEGGKLALSQSDLLMVTSHPAYQGELAVIEEAHQLNKSIFVKKAFASGHLKTISQMNPVAESLQFNLRLKAVASIIVGTISRSHLQQNCEMVLSLQNLT